MTMADAVTDYGIEADTFPAELLAQERWFTWAYDSGRKIPRAPWVDGSGVEQWQSWKDEEIWTDFETVAEWVDKIDQLQHASCIPPREAHDTERLVFFDFDNCRDPETGAIHPHAWTMVVGEDRAAMHGALSTSGTGIHGYAWASVPEGYKPSFEHELDDWAHSDQFDEPAHMEVYAADRFLALTGDHIAETPVSVPCLNNTVHGLFHKFGSQRRTSTDRDPDVSREEIAAMDQTTDIEDIYDAIAHTRPRDIRLQSTVTEDRGDGTKSLDPSWEQSESGTRLAQLDDHWLYRKGNHHLDALQVVALEERIIHQPDAYPSGEEFWHAADELRRRGASIPELQTFDLSGGDRREGAAEAAAVADGAGVATEPTTDESPADGDENDNTEDGWSEIYNKYCAAEDADERLVPRHDAVEQLTTESSWRTLVENDQLWKYDSDAGIYRPDGEARARETLCDELKEQFKAHELREILSQIRGRSLIRESQFGGPAHHIAAENCVIEVHPDEIITHDHDPEYEFIGRVQAPFDPEADCPVFKQFLDDVMPADEREEDRKKIQEYAGYMLMHWGLPHHKALFLVGPTASGKSTFLDAIRTMIGHDAVANLTPQQMTSERFGGSELYGAWANIRNDIPDNLIENTGQFKEIVAGDPIKAEEKFKQPFMFEPVAKHAFSANSLPEPSTDDDAFFRRVMLVAFREQIPRSERDPHLDDKIQAEHAGILNWCIEGLRRLLDQGGFTGEDAPWQTERTWEKWSDSVKRFKSEVLASTTNGFLSSAKVFGLYRQFCENEGIPEMVSKQQLTHQLTSRFGDFERDRRYNDDGQRTRGVAFAELTEDGEALLEQITED
jgi:P4 family phage/plasmid primase-like protien